MKGASSLVKKPLYDDQGNEVRIVYMGKPFYKDGWFWAFAVVVLFLIATNSGIIGKEAQVGQLTESMALENESPPATVVDPDQFTGEFHPDLAELYGYASGLYKVGVNLPAGEYLLQADQRATRAGSWEIKVDLTNYSGFTTASDYTNTFDIVTFETGTDVVLENITAYPISSVPAYPFTRYEEGTYRVGTDLPAGEYQVDLTFERTSEQGYGYWGIDSGSIHSNSGGYSLDSEQMEGPATITVEEGQYLTLKRARIVE